MNFPSAFPLLFIAAFLFSGCGGLLSEKDCHEDGWRKLGLEEGKLGFPLNQMGKYENTCEKYGVPLNKEDYEAGWQEGIERYCDSSNGFSMGKKLEEYNEVCSGKLEAGFLMGYLEGIDAVLRELEWQYRTGKEDLELKKTGMAKMWDKRKIEETDRAIKTQNAKQEALDKKIKEVRLLQSKARERRKRNSNPSYINLL